MLSKLPTVLLLAFQLPTIVSAVYCHPGQPLPCTGPWPPPPTAQVSKVTEVHTQTVTKTINEISWSTTTATSTLTEHHVRINNVVETVWQTTTVTSTETDREVSTTTITNTQHEVSTVPKIEWSTTTETKTSTVTSLSISPSQAVKARAACGAKRGSEWQALNADTPPLSDPNGDLMCCSGYIAKVRPEELV